MQHNQFECLFLALMYMFCSTQSFAEDSFANILMDHPEKSFHRDQFSGSVVHTGRGSKNHRISKKRNKSRASELADFFDMSTGIATTRFSAKDIEYIQQSPQPSINDTLKFVPGMRGEDF